MKVLWLCSWYPNSFNPYDGDFVQRHAFAAAKHIPITVFYTAQYGEKAGINENKVIESNTNGVNEKIIFFSFKKTGLSFLDKLNYHFRYLYVYKKALKEYIEKEGLPDIVHVHMGLKAGIIALWLKKKYTVPFIISEQWTGFLKEAQSNYYELSVRKKAVWKKIMKQSSGFSAVSDYLKNALAGIFNNSTGRVIPNVVNEQIFYPVERALESKPVFVHISNLQPYKNPEMIIRAFKIVTKHCPEARLDMIGATDAKLMSLVTQLEMGDNVTFQKEIPQPLLVKYIRSATALILYSHYETFGCVIIEANACGTPVIVSDIPVFHETVTEGENGIFTKPDDPEDLAQKMLEVIRTRSSFDSKAIASMTGSKYSYETVGKKFSDWYVEILKRAD